MNSRLARLSLTVLSVFVLSLMLTGIALAFPSGGNPGDYPLDSNTIQWTGQGAANGVLNTEACEGEQADAAEAAGYPDGYLHWIFTTDGGSADTDAVLHLSGTGSGDYATSKDSGGAFHFFTPYFTPDSNLIASADFTVLTTGRGAWNLVISHGCPGTTDFEELTVTKTADTSFVRTHNWSIDKSVDTENGYTHDGYPKVWLYIDGHGNETATWTVDVTYGGFVDSDFNVSGEITIENTGTLDAVITDIADVMGGTPIIVACDGDLSLAVGETLTCTYDEDVDSKIEGFNEVTVTTERDEYSANAAIVWGDPTTEVNKTVTVKDISDLFGEVALGTVTAPNNKTFTYTKDFAWADYGQGKCGDYIYNNTATIVETGQSDSATLKVNVQCYIYETAYAKGNSSTCFIPTFSQWGWTNYIATKPTTQTWNLYAGAAMCNLSKGTLVGTVTVTYSTTGFVTVTYNVSAPYIIQETHVYAGATKFPKVLVGKKLVDTVAPGQYYNNGPFSGPIYVIAHAVVGIPDPNFGP